MKTLVALLFSSLLLFEWNTSAAQNASARLFCLSPKVSRGVGIWDSTLDLTSINSGINGELAPSASSYDQEATIFMFNELWFDEPVQGSLFLDLPVFTDSNGDGFDDFFDVTCAASGTSTGTYSFPGWGSGFVQATWTRGAGSHTGVCVLNLQSFGEFNHTFEMLEYRGTMAYTPGSTTVSGVLAAAKSGQPDELLGGPLTFQKSTVDLLTLQSGSLTNAAAQPLPFFSQQYGRDSGWPTNYYGWFEFADYDLSTAEDDFYWWVLSIDDTNDSDGDGIPDFSDEPSAGRRADLSLGKGTSGLTLSIAADVGTTWRVEKSTSLSGGWTLETTVTISTDPQPVLLPEPSTPTFWRAIKQ